jgi:hypothetical protein
MLCRSPWENNEENKEIRGSLFAGCALERLECCGRRRVAHLQPTSLAARPFPVTRKWYIASLANNHNGTVHRRHVHPVHGHQAAHLAIDLSPPNLPPTFTPGPEVQDGLGANARSSWPSLSRVCHSFNRLGIHSRSSSSVSATKPIPDLPALPSQSAERSHLAWRQPAPIACPSRNEKQSSLPWRLYGVACLLSYILTCDALVGWRSDAVTVPQLDPNSHRHDTPTLFYLQVCQAVSLIS